MAQGLTTDGSCDIILPGDNYPCWLTRIGEGHSVLFTVPQDSHGHMKGMALCIVYSSNPENTAVECLINVLIVNHTKCTIHIYKRDTAISFCDEDWQAIISHLGSGDKVEIFATFGHGLAIKKTVVYLIYNESIDMEMEPSPAPVKSSLWPVESYMKPVESSPKPVESSLEPVPVESSLEPVESYMKPMESSPVPVESSMESKKEPKKNAFVKFIKKIVTCNCHRPIIPKA